MKSVWDSRFPSQELVTFTKYVVNRFFALTAQNNKAYIELLFWKNVGAVREMTEGYSKDGSVVFCFLRCHTNIFFFLKKKEGNW